jgi:PBP1b-binding outer membrane lipoprotein LpoB
MLNKSKFVLAVIICFLLVTACSKFRGEKDSDKNKQQTTQPEQKDQYRIAENFVDNKSQFIDLIEGPATFDIKYEGNGNFVCKILNSDGTVLDILADVNGNYKGTKSITVPKTTSYILDVKCRGVWSVYRK